MLWRTWCNRTDGLVAFGQVWRVGDHSAAGGRTADGDVGDGRRRWVDQCVTRTAGVQHDHGGTGTDDAHTGTNATATSGAHRTRTAVATGVPAGALGPLAAVVHMVAYAHPSGPLSHFVDIFVVVLTGRCTRIAAPVRWRRAQVFVRSGTGTAVAAMHLYLNCRHRKIGRG